MNEAAATDWETRRAAVLSERSLMGFDSWAALRAHAESGADPALFYWAPMDRFPTRVHVRRVFKNGSVRVSPGMAGANAFTSDADHLDRFFMPIPPAAHFARLAAEHIAAALVDLASVEGRAHSPETRDRARAARRGLLESHGAAWALVTRLEES